jgi:CHASE2 domain-containing sensor protein/serine phosphatase RsbU (regulator of sigma subunit)
LKNLLAVWLSKIWRAGDGRIAAAAILTIVTILLHFPDLPPFKFARSALFDQYQRLFPRQPQSSPVVIVAIDEESLALLGQWPWPRNYFAALVDTVSALKPAAVGLDIIMPEHDRASPEAILESRPDLPESIHKALLGVTSNDYLLAKSLANTPVVLGAAGFKFKTSATLEGLLTRSIEVQGNDPLPWLTSYSYVLASLPEFQAAAHGQQALLSSDSENGIVRRVAVLSNLNNQIIPGLTLEMLRVAYAAPAIVVSAGKRGVESVTIGAQRIPLQSNGEVWVHFSKVSAQRFISASSLLNNKVPPERIAGKLVLIGLTGLGLQDFITTPLGDMRPGVEVHAQLLESFADSHFLTRPWWMHWLESVVLVSSGLMLIWVIPNARPTSTIRCSAEQRVSTQRNITTRGGASEQREKRSVNRASVINPKFLVILVTLQFVLLFGTGMAVFYWGGLLFDASSLFIMLSVVFSSLLFSIFIESSHLRRSTEIAFQNQRVKAAKLTGELDAARRIQLGTLPMSATAFPGETRFEIDAMLEPARQVGGDLYDFFMIDRQRLFFIIGDVSGKGVPASLFMVVTKALGKSVALRGNAGIGEIVSMANRDMARENPEMLFVTAVAGILDVETGALELVNAGHDAPLRIDVTGHMERVRGEGGPPLCVFDDFIYPVEHFQLAVGDTLLLLTDGITEAMNVNKDLYSMERVEAALHKVTPEQRPNAFVIALREDVRTFVGNAEPSDDMTLLVLRWLGAGNHSTP